MSEEHIDSILDSQSPEEEFADEIKAYEEEEAKKADAEKEPEADLEADAETNEVDEDGSQLEAQAEADQADEGDKGQQSKQVPVSALQAVRAENQQLRNQMNQIGMMLQQMQQQQPMPQPGQQQEAAPPDPSEDPIGAMEWLIKSQQQFEQRTQQERQMQMEQARQAQFAHQVQQAYVAQANQFSQQQPDFNNAYQHLVKSRMSELMATGMPQEQAVEALNREEMALAAQSLQQGINPAQRIYEMAKYRGYVPGSKPTQTQQRQPDPAVEQAKRAAATNTNRAAPPSKDMTWERVAELEGAAFDKAFEAMMRREGGGDRKIV